MSEVSYWYAPGMESPWWCGHTAGDESAGAGHTCWYNAEADTDMGNLWDDEFRTYFPHAFEVTEQEFIDQTLREDGDTRSEHRGE